MIKRFVHSLLVAAVTLSMIGASLAQGLAHATQPSEAVQTVVICAGGAEKEVLLDARGNPLDPDAVCTERLCPDCLHVAAAVLPANGALFRFLCLAREGSSALAEFTLPNHRPAHEAARGPPLKV